MSEAAEEISTSTTRRTATATPVPPMATPPSHYHPGSASDHVENSQILNTKNPNSTFHYPNREPY
ncbi:hypothetical protein L484_000330 [Morus notabilis]|uniref:Uncharacterized protein n=1 Tax=Morus notabilis TaxID=981085 RepID=W9RXR9_9ROSA|nr:hypothetical protein L484_000330 [Morus notabilis]